MSHHLRPTLPSSSSSLSSLGSTPSYILQDGAVLYFQHPKLPIFQFYPFNTLQFQTFAAELVQ